MSENMDFLLHLGHCNYDIMEIYYWGPRKSNRDERFRHHVLTKVRTTGPVL